MGRQWVGSRSRGETAAGEKDQTGPDLPACTYLPAQRQQILAEQPAAAVSDDMQYNTMWRSRNDDAQRNIHDNNKAL